MRSVRRRREKSWRLRAMMLTIRTHLVFLRRTGGSSRRQRSVRRSRRNKTRSISFRIPSVRRGSFVRENRRSCKRIHHVFQGKFHQSQERRDSILSSIHLSTIKTLATIQRPILKEAHSLIR